MLDFKIEKLTVGQWKVNVYFLIIENDTWIVDPGDDFKLLVSYIETNNLNVLGILLTHGHFDHIASAEKLKQKYGVEIHMHSKDKKILRQANLYRKLSGGTGIQKTPIIERYLDDIDSIKFNDNVINIYQTPGHSSGSISLEINNHLIIGDLFFYNKIGSTNLPGGNVEELKKSIILLANQFKDFNIQPGHGRTFKFDEERIICILNILNGDNN